MIHTIWKTFNQSLSLTKNVQLHSSSCSISFAPHLPSVYQILLLHSPWCSCLTDVKPPWKYRHQCPLPGLLRFLSRSLLYRMSIPHNLSHQAQMSATSLALTLLTLPHTHAHTYTHTLTHSPPLLSPPSAEHMKALQCLFGFHSPPPLSVLHSLFIQAAPWQHIHSFTALSS